MSCFLKDVLKNWVGIMFSGCMATPVDGNFPEVVQQLGTLLSLALPHSIKKKIGQLIIVNCELVVRLHY